MLPLATYAMIRAGFSEETVFRGFLFERLGKLLGGSARAKGFDPISGVLPAST